MYQYNEYMIGRIFHFRCRRGVSCDLWLTLVEEHCSISSRDLTPSIGGTFPKFCRVAIWPFTANCPVETDPYSTRRR